MQIGIGDTADFKFYAPTGSEKITEYAASVFA